MTKHAAEFIQRMRDRRVRPKWLGHRATQADLFHRDVTRSATIHDVECGNPGLVDSTLKPALQRDRVVAAVNQPEIALTVFVTWSGGSKTLTAGEVSFVSSTLVQMTITTQNDPDNWTVKVTNPSGGGSSSAFPFTVLAPTPSITSLTTNPSAPTPGTFTFTISGSGFFPGGALIRVTGPSCTPCTIPNNVLTTKTTTTLSGPATLNTAGSYSFVVQNGFLASNGADGPKSGGANVTVGNGNTAPTITSVSPNPVTGSTSSQTIAINGTGFVNPPTVFVTWSGGSKTLTAGEVSFVSSTLVQMTITTSTTADNWTVKITNPDGRVSNTQGFQVVTPAPHISSISPSSPTHSASNQTVTVSGTNFLAGLTVSITFPSGGGTTLSGSQIQNVTSTSFQMVVTLSATGTWTIRVNNPNSQQSNTFSFNVI